MAERKDQLGNVAFGGNWSEEILIFDQLNQVLTLVETAADKCADLNAETEELCSAMLFVQENIEKGPMLARAFIKALQIENQNQRQAEALRIAKMIRTWGGL